MNTMELTLAEQMHITEASLARRRELLWLRDADLQLLRTLKPLIVANLEPIVAEFFQKHTPFDEMARLIGDADTLQRRYAEQKRYILDLFSGVIDMEYVNNRLRVGMIHKKHGIEPQLYFSAVEALSGILWSHLMPRAKTSAAIMPALEAVRKLLYFDMSLVFDTYIHGIVSEASLAIQRAETYSQEITSLAQSLADLAVTDELTGLLNRRELFKVLCRELKRAERESSPLCLLFIDVDNFKEINDRHGHQEGDRILLRLAEAIQCVSRETDTAGRFGGDEFCVLLPHTHLAMAVKYSERLLSELGANSPGLALSIGIAQSGPDDFDCSERIVYRADKHMYHSKQRQGSWVSYCERPSECALCAIGELGAETIPKRMPKDRSAHTARMGRN